MIPLKPSLNIKRSSLNFIRIRSSSYAVNVQLSTFNVILLQLYLHTLTLVLHVVEGGYYINMPKGIFWQVIECIAGYDY